MSEPSDPIVERRARIRRFVGVAQRAGYGAMAVAVATPAACQELAIPA